MTVGAIETGGGTQGRAETARAAAFGVGDPGAAAVAAAAGAGAPGDETAGVGVGDRRDHPLATSDSYARLDPVLRGFLRRRVPPDDVDDVVQAAFADLWRTRARYDPGRSLEAWALTIARRRAIDHLRARPQPAVPLAAVAEPPGDDGREIAARLADAAELRSALSALPRAQREAIELAYYVGLTQREIADRLRVPIGTVKARTARGLRGARRFLMSAGHDGEGGRGAA